MTVLLILEGRATEFEDELDGLRKYGGVAELDPNGTRGLAGPGSGGASASHVCRGLRVSRPPTHLPTMDRPVLSSTRWRPSPGGTGRRQRRKC